MFKGILPASKRGPEFTIVNAGSEDIPTSNGKENYHAFPQPPTTKSQTGSRFMQKRRMSRSESQDQPIEADQAFDKLLDDLQIPSTIRPKLIGMESSVKAAMLKSSKVVTPAPQQPTTPRGLRKAHSSDSISITSPHRSSPSVEYDLAHARTAGRSAGNALATASHSRGMSMDVPRPTSRTYSSFGGDSSKSKSKEKPSKGAWSPAKFCGILDSTSSSLLDIDIVKKLRLHLRNEAASWTEDFLQEGGYDSLVARLNEILDFEWREEQHDDQLLHALLQCFKALSTSDVGCSAIRSSYPTPFLQLITLLYSDKKPGEVATRQLIVEFILLIFELYPSGCLPNSGESSRRREVWEIEDPFVSAVIILPYPHKSVFSLIRSLLLTPAPLGAEAPEVPLSPHEFIENLHRPRIYKTYLQELSDICRDYFWVFCHPNNTIWNLRECDETKAERPRAPGGMTGGVEAEAMRYMTLHFKFLNLIANSVAELNLPRDHEHSAYTFHSDLFLSGLERMILIGRKASTLYYPTLHLEIARYVQSAGIARYELPWSISRLIGAPPSAVAKSPSANASAAASKPREAPVGSKKMTPLNF